MRREIPAIHPDSESSAKSTAGICLMVFLFAAALRIIFLLQYSSSPAFSTPIIDDASYDRAARILAGEMRMDPELFWHGFLYPAFLSATYAVSGGSVIFARYVQAILGGLTAVAVFFLGSRLIDRKTGIIASLITAAYGPLIFFDTQLLATGLATFFAPVLLIITLNAKGEIKSAKYFLFGICAGLAIITRATFLPYVSIAFLLLTFKLMQKRLPRRTIAVRGGVAAAGILAVLLPVAVASGLTTGYFNPLPRSGSVNLYIGNNPDTDLTMTVRPGAEWRQLLARPRREGHDSEKEYRQYFIDRFEEYAFSDPAAFAAGLGRKTLRFLSTRELPRNFDVYTMAGYSKLLSLLTWKAWKFGFPFGFLLPFAAYGLYVHRRGLPLAFWAFLVLYPAAVILIFTSSRLRAPVIPVLSVPAAAGIITFGRLLRGRRLWRVALVTASIVLIAVGASFYGPYVTEDYDYRAEMYSCVAYQLSLSGHNDAAVENLETALEKSPEFLPAHRILGCVLQEQGRNDEAVQHFEKVLMDDPDEYVVHYYIGVALLKNGEIEKGAVHLRRAEEGAKRARDSRIIAEIRKIIGGQ